CRARSISARRRRRRGSWSHRPGGRWWPWRRPASPKMAPPAGPPTPEPVPPPTGAPNRASGYVPSWVQATLLVKKRLALDAPQQVGHLDRSLGCFGALVVLGT